MNLPVILAIAGCAALLAGLFGGGVKAKEIVVPKLSTMPRIFSSLAGLVLIGIAIWMSPRPSTAVSPTQILPTDVPSTQILATYVPPTQIPPTEAPPPTAILTKQSDTSSSMVTTAATQADLDSQAVFVHFVLSGNMAGNTTDIEHALASDPKSLLFVMSNFNPPKTNRGVYNRHLIALWYRGSQWTIVNQDMDFMPQDTAFNIQIRREGEKNVFIQTATSANSSGSWTVIDDPSASDPDALVFAMPTWSPSGGNARDNPHPIGVWYTGSKWAIFNLDGAPMREGAAFNVEILSQGKNAFIHGTTPSNTTKNWTVLDNRSAFDENKLVFVMPRGSPDGKEANNSQPIGVWYPGSAWAIFNQNEGEPMPIGTSFNILILDAK